MVEKKTACLLEASAAIGAMVATDAEERIRAAAQFGRNLGLAFQAHDDLLDALGDERVMGKPAGLDARNGRQTFLTLAHPSCAPAAEATASPHEAARAVVARHTDAACRLLDTLPPSPSREMLRDLATMLTNRQS
jgi:geranylgeranyl pyrophosphate synthase